MKQPEGGPGLGHAIGVIFKTFFYSLQVLLLSVCLMAVIALLFGGIAWWPVNNFLWTKQLAAVFLPGLHWSSFNCSPLLVLLHGLYAALQGAKIKNPYLGWVFGGLVDTRLGSCNIICCKSIGGISEDTVRQHLMNLWWNNLQKQTQSLQFHNRNWNTLAVLAGWAKGGNGWDITDDTLRIGAVKITVNQAR